MGVSFFREKYPLAFGSFELSFQNLCVYIQKMSIVTSFFLAIGMRSGLKGDFQPSHAK